MNTTQKKRQQNNKRKNSSGFFPFALIVFAALAVGLIVILMRSQA